MHLIVARSSSGASRAMMDSVFRRLWEVGTPGVLLSCPRDEGAFLGDTRPMLLPPGRAHYITRRRAVLLQTAYSPADQGAVVAVENPQPTTAP
jgi:S-DNA-T family DNA segregation ATPase FtsK/SpoIIIE